MKTLKFTKLVATGNDFILVDNRRRAAEKIVKDLSRFAQVICERKRSVGADGLLVLEDSKKANITMRIFNPDGSEVTMCGNGSRCIAYYAVRKRITRKKLTIDTKAGILKAVVSGNNARINMTDPRALKLGISIDVEGKSYKVSFINTGVPHAVYIVTDLKSVNVKDIGRATRYHKLFAPEGANANFIKIEDDHNISIRTYERGVEDETLACGTGSVAGALVSCALGGTKSPVKVKTRGGDMLNVLFKKSGREYKNVYLEGKVRLVFDGVLEI